MTKNPKAATRDMMASDAFLLMKQHNITQLVVAEKGKYYGHPNPSRSEYVLNGGNPTTAKDPMEVSEYPVGITTDKNYQYPAYDFGKNYSPNGLGDVTGIQ